MNYIHCSPSESLVIHKSFKYRLRINRNQLHFFARQAGCARFIYNWGLAKWIEQYGIGLKPSVFSISNELTLLKQQPEFEWLNEVSSQVLQQSLANLGLAFKNFFAKRGKYPTFKKKGRKESFRIPQHFDILPNMRQLKLPKVGYVKLDKNRRIEGQPKFVTISKTAGDWYASVTCEIEIPKPARPNNEVVGLDVGVVRLATMYDGSVFTVHRHNPKLKDEYAKLVKYQKRYSHKQKGSQNQKKARYLIAKQHARISNMRLDRLHKTSTYLAKNHGWIGIEDLVITNMSKSASGTVEKPGRKVAQKRGLNRSIQQQGWGILAQQLLYKARWYGSTINIVDAKYTSQTCPACGHVSRGNRLSQAKFICEHCGYTENADNVASINIRDRAVNGYES